MVQIKVANINKLMEPYHRHILHGQFNNLNHQQTKIQQQETQVKVS